MAVSTVSNDAELRTRSALEAGFRAILALFAALLGFGLKHILDLENKERLPDLSLELELLVRHRWPLFIIASAMFARYFIGAAVHMTFEHIHRAADTSRATLLQDVLFLGIYALIGMGVSYATSLTTAFLWLLVLNVFALLWTGFDRQVRKYQPLRGTAPWSFFVWINLTGIAVFALALTFMWRWPELAFAPALLEMGPWNWYWLSLVVGAGALLMVDVGNQLRVIGVRQ